VVANPLLAHYFTMEVPVGSESVSVPSYSNEVPAIGHIQLVTDDLPLIELDDVNVTTNRRIALGNGIYRYELEVSGKISQVTRAIEILRANELQPVSLFISNEAVCNADCDDISNEYSGSRGSHGSNDDGNGDNNDNGSVMQDTDTIITSGNSTEGCGSRRAFRWNSSVQPGGIGCQLLQKEQLPVFEANLCKLLLYKFATRMKKCSFHPTQGGVDVRIYVEIPNGNIELLYLPQDMQRKFLQRANLKYMRTHVILANHPVGMIAAIGYDLKVGRDIITSSIARNDYIVSKICYLHHLPALPSSAIVDKDIPNEIQTLTDKLLEAGYVSICRCQDEVDLGAVGQALDVLGFTKVRTNVTTAVERHRCWFYFAHHFILKQIGSNISQWVLEQAVRLMRNLPFMITVGGKWQTTDTHRYDYLRLWYLIKTRIGYDNVDYTVNSSLGINIAFYDLWKTIRFVDQVEQADLDISSVNVMDTKLEFIPDTRPGHSNKSQAWISDPSEEHPESRVMNFNIEGRRFSVWE